MIKKINLGVMALEEDRNLIKKVADLQRRSIASFIIESSILRAKEILKSLEVLNATTN